MICNDTGHKGVYDCAIGKLVDECWSLVVVVEVNHATFCDVTANLNVPLQT